MDKIESFLLGLVNGLLKRNGKSTMAQFNIMCRRYAGFRPCDDSDSNVTVAELCKSKFLTPIYCPLSINKTRKHENSFVNLLVPYCPDEAMYLCDALCELRGVVQRSRLSGFTLDYTKMLLSAIFSESDDEPEYVILLFKSVLSFL